LTRAGAEAVEDRSKQAVSAMLRLRVEVRLRWSEGECRHPAGTAVAHDTLRGRAPGSANNEFTW